MENFTKQEALEILGFHHLCNSINSRKPRLTAEQSRAKIREELRARDLQRAKDLGLIKPKTFRNGIIYKGKGTAGNP